MPGTNSWLRQWLAVIQLLLSSAVGIDVKAKPFLNQAVRMFIYLMTWK